ncbi:methionyl-tRNA formyltransferase [Flavobacteriales bacterium 33_180_T64]|nr:methionyl-tRNA formyltransferase [Flavobacteriales bacterium 33_180_T64]
MIDDIEYNTEREHLIIPEYGRHLQKMINYAKELPTKEERNKVAKSIINVMGNLQPHLRDVPDFQHKLWDQLFIIADFQLDADSPYPMPSKEQLTAGPEPLEYPQNFPKYRFYGNNIKTMIDIANTWEDGDLKEALVYTIANHMKKCFLNWNKDTVEDYVIFNHLYELSDGKINLKESKEDLSDSTSLMRNKKKYSSNKKPHHKKNTSNRNRKRY